MDVKPISTRYYETVVIVDGEEYKIGFDSLALSLQNSRGAGWQLWDNETKIGDEFYNDEFKIFMNNVLVYSNVNELQD
jgi:hypothetical protein